MENKNSFCSVFNHDHDCRLALGASYLEVVIITALITTLAIAAFLGWRAQISKGQDAKRKDDLEKIKIAFEDYYNDHHCYPPATVLQDCGSNNLAPYLSTIPCDPLTGQPYQVVVEDSDCPQWFAVFAQMERTEDAKGNECAAGCLINQEEYNYAVSSSNVSPSEIAGLQPTPTPGGANCGEGCFQVDLLGQCNISTGCIDNDGELDKCFTDSNCSLECAVTSCGE